jgi:VanZ family protein
LSKILKFIPAILWLMISFWLFTLPGSAIPEFDTFHKLQGDKLIHAFIFFLLGYLFIAPLKHNITTTKKRLNWFIAITILLMLYGIGIEFIQKHYIPFRSFDLGDIIADCIGSLLALKFAFKVWGKEASSLK